MLAKIVGVKKNQNGHFFEENQKNKNIQLSAIEKRRAVCFYFLHFPKKNGHFDFFYAYFQLQNIHIFTSISNDYYSVICLCRMIFSTIFGHLGQKSIQIWFWILPDIFGRCQKFDFKKRIFPDFGPFFGLLQG